MKILKFPFLYLSLFFVLGILSYPFFDKWLLLVAVVISTSFLAIAIGHRIFLYSYSRIFYWVLIFSTFWCLGTISIALHTATIHTKHYLHTVISEDKAFLKLIIQERLKSNQHSNRYIAKLVVLNKDRSVGKLLVQVPNKLQDSLLVNGDILEVYQSIRPINKAVNPHQFDYRSYLEKQGVYGQVYLEEDNYIVNGKFININSLASTWRDKLLSAFDIHSFSPEVIGVVRALLFGQRQDLSSDLIKQFKEVGVVHVLAVSGLHIGILYLFVFHLLKRMGFGIKFIYGAGIAVLWVFALLSGFGTTVVRAVVLFTVFGLVQLLRARSDRYNSLAIAFLAMLCFNPYYIYDIGFQLSFTAVFSIILLYPVLQVYTNSRWWFWRYIKELIAISLAVQIGLLPLTLYYFHYFPTFFLIGNFFIVPLVTVILLSLFSLLLLNFGWETLALLIGSFVGFAIELMNVIVHFLSHFSEFNFENIFFNEVLALVSGLALVFVVYWVKVRKTRDIMILMVVVLVLQLVYFSVVVNDWSKKEVLLLYDRDFTSLIFKNRAELKLISSDSMVLQKQSIRDYSVNHFVKTTTYVPMSRLLKIGDRQLLIVDSLGLYKTVSKADIILFVGTPKLNFVRVIDYHRPSLILVDATFPLWESKRLERVCDKKNIPFHSVSEKGYFKF